MRHLRICAIFALVSLLSGCGWLSSAKPERKAPQTVLKGVEWAQPQKFHKGGGLLIVPFSPGSKVTASDATERLSLMIVKGCADVVVADSSGFSVLNDDNAIDADMIIRGRIELASEKASGFLGFFRKVHKSIIVSGKITDADDGGLIMAFSHSRRSDRKAVSLDELALTVGKDLGNFLINTE